MKQFNILGKIDLLTNDGSIIKRNLLYSNKIKNMSLKQIRISLSHLFGTDLDNTQAEMIYFLLSDKGEIEDVLSTAEMNVDEVDKAAAIDNLINGDEGVREQLRMIINN